jgi:hypothetical protein
MLLLHIQRIGSYRRAATPASSWKTAVTWLGMRDSFKSKSHLKKPPQARTWAVFLYKKIYIFRQYRKYL